jgi:hypothetical protein
MEAMETTAPFGNLTDMMLTFQEKKPPKGG